MDICAVIVTYNRLEKLKKALTKYNDQTRRPNKVIVVDNASKEDTKAFLKEWLEKDDGYQKIVLTLDKNYGCSGGLYRGMQKALEIGFDWIWIADDDSYPDERAFEILESKIKENPPYKVISSEVINKFGICLIHRTRISRENKIPYFKPIALSEYDKESFEYDTFSFVGTGLSKEVVDACGLVREDFFIWNDDTEYSLRIGKKYKMVCFPSIKVYHDDDQTGATNLLSWKQYYGERNMLEIFSLHFSKFENRAYTLKFKLRLLKHRFDNRLVYDLLKTAYSDFKHRKFGISEKYKPGMKLE